MIHVRVILFRIYEWEEDLWKKLTKKKFINCSSFISSCIIFYVLDNYFGLYSRFNKTPLIYVLIAGIIIAFSFRNVLSSRSNNFHFCIRSNELEQLSGFFRKPLLNVLILLTSILNSTMIETISKKKRSSIKNS